MMTANSKPAMTACQEADRGTRGLQGYSRADGLELVRVMKKVLPSEPTEWNTVVKLYNQYAANNSRPPRSLGALYSKFKAWVDHSSLTDPHLCRCPSYVRVAQVVHELMNESLSDSASDVDEPVCDIDPLSPISNLNTQDDRGGEASESLCADILDHSKTQLSPNLNSSMEIPTQDLNSTSADMHLAQVNPSSGITDRAGTLSPNQSSAIIPLPAWHHSQSAKKKTIQLEHSRKGYFGPSPVPTTSRRSVSAQAASRGTGQNAPTLVEAKARRNEAHVQSPTEAKPINQHEHEKDAAQPSANQLQEVIARQQEEMKELRSAVELQMSRLHDDHQMLRSVLNQHANEMQRLSSSMGSIHHSMHGPSYANPSSQPLNRCYPYQPHPYYYPAHAPLPPSFGHPGYPGPPAGVCAASIRRAYPHAPPPPNRSHLVFAPPSHPLPQGPHRPPPSDRPASPPPPLDNPSQPCLPNLPSQSLPIIIN